MKIVKFRNGQFGIRKFSIRELGYIYLDLTVAWKKFVEHDVHFQDSKLWRNDEDRYFHLCHCLTQHITEIETILKAMKNKDDQKKDTDIVAVMKAEDIDNEDALNAFMFKED